MLDETITAWNAVSTYGMERLWQASVTGSLYLLLVWAICRLLPRIPPSARAWLWWLACLKLLLGLFWIEPLLPRSKSIGIAISTPSAPSVITRSLFSSLGTGSPSLPSASFDAPSGDESASASASSIHLSPLALLGLLWIAALAFALSRTAHRYRFVSGLRRDSRRIEEERALKIAEELSARLVLTRPPEIRESKDAPGPLVIGLRHPVILLPENVFERYGESEFRMALAHELAHLSRRDLFAGLIPVLTNVVFYFHPLAWAACREWRAAVEFACDERALRATGAPLGDYGRLLLRMVEENQPSRILGAMGATSDYRILERRLTMIGTLSPRARGKLRLGLALIAALGALCFIPWRLQAGKTPPMGLLDANFKEHAMSMEPKARDLVRQMETAYANLRSFTATFRSEANGDKIPPDLTGSRVTLRLMRPDYVTLHIETKGRTIDAASNSEGTFVYDSNQPNAYTKTSARSDAKALLNQIFKPGESDSRGMTSMLAIFAGASVIDSTLVSLAIGPSSEIDGEAVSTLIGRSQAKGSSDAANMKIYLGATDHLLRRIEFSSKNPAMRYSETCSNVRINPDLSTGDFAFAPPPQAKEKTIFTQAETDRANGIVPPEPKDGVLDVAYHNPVLREIAGTILLPDGKPAGGTKVSWISRNQKGESWTAATTFADETGQFAFSNPEILSKKAFVNQLYAEAAGEGVAFTDELLQDSGEMRIVLHPVTELRLPFVDETGKPVPNLSVRLRSLREADAPGPRTQTDRIPSHVYFMWEEDQARIYKTDEKGVLTIPNLPQSCSLQLSQEDARFAQIFFGHGIRLAVASVTKPEAVKLLPCARICGKVTYPDHRPAVGITVGTQSVDQEDNHDYAEAMTNARGEYEIKGLNPGFHNVALALYKSGGNLEKEWTAPAHERVSLTTGGRANGIDFTLEKGATISGKVTTESGIPVKGAYVGCYGPARPNSGAWVQAMDTTEDGSFFFRVPPGEQHVYMGSVVPGYRSMVDKGANLSVRDGEAKRQDFTLVRE